MKLSCVACFILATFASAAEPTPLETKVREIAKAHQGKVAVAVKNLATGEGFSVDGAATR